MNEKLMNQVAEMKKQTIGVEVEMNSIERSKAAKLAAEFFGTGRWQDTARRNGYSSWSAWDAQGREWKFQKDVSIRGPDSEKCEMVTPILTYADMDLLQGLVRRLRKAGAKSDATRGCGVHIHIGAQGHDAKSLRNLANIMASHERLLADAFNLDRYRMSEYCKTVSPAFLDKLNREKPTTMADLAEIWYTSNGASCSRSAHYNSSRYHMLNLHATFTKGTIEFRLFQFDAPTAERKNGLHAGQLKSYIQLCLTLSQMATAGVLMGKRSNGRFIIADVSNRQMAASDVRKTILMTAQMDRDKYGDVRIRLPQDPGQAGKEQAQSYIKFLSGFNVTTELESGSKESRAEPMVRMADGLITNWSTSVYWMVCLLRGTTILFSWLTVMGLKKFTVPFLMLRKWRCKSRSFQPSLRLRF